MLHVVVGGSSFGLWHTGSLDEDLGFAILWVMRGLSQGMDLCSSACFPVKSKVPRVVLRGEWV